MKDAYEVLYNKEAELARVRREIASLNMVASMLADDPLSFFDPPRSGLNGQNKKPAEKEISLPTATGATGTRGRSPAARRTGFWGSLKRRR